MNGDIKAAVADLDMRLSNASVTLVDEGDKIYRVFVPGAFREENFVKADDEKEALAKARDVLTQKLSQRITKKIEVNADKEPELDVQDADQEQAAPESGGDE